MTIDGKPACIGILRDLSKRVAIETALRKSDDRLRSIVESALDGIVAIDELFQSLCGRFRTSEDSFAPLHRAEAPISLDRRIGTCRSLARSMLNRLLRGPTHD